jgi:hypothetical protein
MEKCNICTSHTKSGWCNQFGRSASEVFVNRQGYGQFNCSQFQPKPQQKGTNMQEPKFWVVWNPSKSLPFVRHDNKDEAKKEAKRLASIDVNDTFYVLECVGRAKSVAVEYKEI